MADINGKERTQLSDDELEGVSGGSQAESIPSGKHFPCIVTDVYWGDSNQTTPAYGARISQNADVEYVPGTPGQCKYKLFYPNTNNQFGWTIQGHFDLLV